MVLALMATAGWAQTRTWNNIVTGYSNLPFVKVTKVVLSADSTEVFLHFDMPSQLAGQEGPLAVKSQLQADGKTYEAKRAIGVKLGQFVKIPQDGKVDISLVFDALPASTWRISVSDPGMWTLNGVRDADAIPTGITDTYWRNTLTGDWLIGFAQHHVIYNNKVWDILNQTEQKGTYELTLSDGLTIKVGKLKKGIRPITIGREKAIAPYQKAAEAARDAGLGLNAGHDLNLDNLAYFIRTIPWTDEVSIGHALISDALYLGLERTIKEYLARI